MEVSFSNKKIKNGKRYVLPFFLLLSINTFGQEMELKLSPADRHLNKSSVSVAGSSKISKFPFDRIAFKDGTYSYHFITRIFRTTSGSEVAACIAIQDSVFKIVADVNGNGDLKDDTFYTLQARDTALSTFPEFHFNKALGMSVDVLAIVPVTRGGEIIYNAGNANLKEIKFGLISYDFLQSAEFIMGKDTCRLFLSKAGIQQISSQDSIASGNYINYQLDKKTSTGNFKFVDFGGLLDLLNGDYSRPHNLYSISVTKVDLVSNMITINIKKNDSELSAVSLEKLHAISVNSGRQEQIVFTEKPSLFIFSGSWCKPCYEIKPAMDKFQKTNKERFNFVYILREKDLPAARKFAKSNAYTSNVYFEQLGAKSVNSVHEMLGAGGYPTVIIINSKGNILFKESGSNLVEKLHNTFDE
jgi:thiol-disulfide isomerase/thioredoxin